MDGQFECNNIDIYAHMNGLYESCQGNSFYSHEGACGPKAVNKTLPEIEIWSIGMAVNEASINLMIPEEAVRRVFNFCTTYASSALTSHKDEQIGGRYRIVVVDIYPSGCEKFGYPYREDNRNMYFCMAELKDSSPNYQFEVMDVQEKSSSRDAWIVKTILQKIKPFTTVVIDTDAIFCDPGVMGVVEKLGVSFVSVESLKRHDTEHTSVLNSLQTIWMPALQLCEEDYAED